MKTLKNCKSCCGKIKSGGQVKSIKRYDNGGTAGDPPVQNLHEVTITGNKKAYKEKKKGMKIINDLIKRGTTTPVKDSSGGYKWLKGQKGMSVKSKYKDGGTIVGMPEYGNNPRTYSGAILKKGGAAKNAKLAAVAPPKNKVTRADVLTRILKKKKK